MNSDGPSSTTLLVPVFCVRDLWLFPGCSVSLSVTSASDVRGVEMARRSGGHVFVATQRDADNPRDLHSVGTLSEVGAVTPSVDGPLTRLEGLRRARILNLVGGDPLVAEIVLLEEEEPGEDWGPAVEALARYFHTHPELRVALDERRGSAEPMTWVNLACQHLPIASTARQKLLEASAAERCQKISRGLHALLRKEGVG